MDKTCCGHFLPMFCAFSFHGNSMNNLLSLCGLIDAKIKTSDKDLPVKKHSTNKEFSIRLQKTTKKCVANNGPNLDIFLMT